MAPPIQQPQIEISQEPGIVGNFHWNEGVIKGLWTFNNGQISTLKIFFLVAKFWDLDLICPIFGQMGYNT